MNNDTLAKLAADNVPERIYLVLGEDIAPDDDPRADFDDLADVNWCIDKQFEHDIEYVRADVAALTAQALPAAEPVAWQSRFESSKAWYECTKEHHDWVRRAPKEFPGYEARELFATPQPPQPDNLTSKSALKRIEVQAKPQGDA